jgi:hypothetical protein
LLLNYSSLSANMIYWMGINRYNSADTVGIHPYQETLYVSIVLNILIVFLMMMGYAIPTAAIPSQADLEISVQQEAERGKYQLINADDLWELYQDTSKNGLLIDTRQDWEYRTGHIVNAIHFSMEPTWFSRLIQRHALAQKLGPDKNQILVFY